MKNSIRQILSFSMALLVLFSTFSFTVDMHFCGKDLLDVSFVQNSRTCEIEMRDCNRDHQNSMDEKSCCTDTSFTVQGQDQIKASFDKLNLDQQIFIASFVYTYFNLFEGLEDHIVPFRDYSSPLLVRDLMVLHETFLI